MTDINELAQSLKAAAEKALQGEWEYEANAIWNTDENGWVQHMASVESGDDVSDGEHNSNMQFITTATPANVLTIIDALSESQSQAGNYSNCDDNTINLAIKWQARCKDTEVRLEAAKMRVVELVEALEKAQQRNAELEHAQSLHDEGVYMLCGQFDELAAAMGWTSELAEKQGLSQLEYARGIKLRIAELESRAKAAELLAKSHKSLRDSMAAIYNTIHGDGAYVSLSVLLSASKRAYDESTQAAKVGIQIQGGE